MAASSGLELKSTFALSLHLQENLEGKKNDFMMLKLEDNKGKAHIQYLGKCRVVGRLSWTACLASQSTAIHFQVSTHQDVSVACLPTPL